MTKLKVNLITKSKETRLHGCHIPVIGFTGGIASGKSTASKMLEEKGFKIICADEIIKSIYGEAVTIQFVEKNWPDVILNKQINFIELRKLFFNDKNIQESLENFLYQRMPEKFLAKVESSDETITRTYPGPGLSDSH